MTATVDSNPTCNARQMAHAPRPLPMWMQVGVVVLLLAQGVQTAIHWSYDHARPASSVAATQNTSLSRFEYTYQPDRLVSAAQTSPSTVPQTRYDYNPYGSVRVSGNMQSSFQYSGSFAHAPSAVKVTPMKAYDVSPGRWVERDPLPAK
jgi:hypothetical protein